MEDERVSEKKPRVCPAVSSPKSPAKEIVTTETSNSTVSEEYTNEVDVCKRMLRRLMYNLKCAHLVLQLAHANGGRIDTVVAKTNSPSDPPKNPLDACRVILNKTKEDYPILSFSDFYELARVVAIEITGGPKVSFNPGRQDKLEPPPESFEPPAEGQQPGCTEES